MCSSASFLKDLYASLQKNRYHLYLVYEIPLDISYYFRNLDCNFSLNRQGIAARSHHSLLCGHCYNHCYRNYRL